MSIQYLDLEVQLIGTDGNAFALIGRASGAIRREHGQAASTEFFDAATSSASYDDLLRLVGETVVIA